MRQGYFSHLLIVWLLSLPGAWADEPNADVTLPDANGEVVIEDRRDLLERQKQTVETQVQRAAQWVDSFFADPDHDAEIASSQFRFRPEIYYRNEQGTKLGARNESTTSRVTGSSRKMLRKPLAVLM